MTKDKWLKFRKELLYLVALFLSKLKAQSSKFNSLSSQKIVENFYDYIFYFYNKNCTFVV